jgi:NAD(P)-dependent dehydrogenase (short-subunit alcohol dehydrogenase family)
MNGYDYGLIVVGAGSPGAAKGALTNFGNSLSEEFGPRGVRVDTISPGPVETVVWLADHRVAATVARAIDSHLDEVAKQTILDTSTGRFTHRQQVADLVLLLASDRTGNVTGTDVLVDGGLVKAL